MYHPEDMVPWTLAQGEHDRNPPHFAMTQEPVTAKDFLERFGDPWVHGGHSHLFDPSELRKKTAVYYGMVNLDAHAAYSRGMTRCEPLNARLVL